MFTANLISEGIDKEQGSIYWRVEFTDGVETFAKQYRFSIDSTLLQRKKAVKYDLDNLNATPETLTVGEIDVSDVVDPAPVEPTQAELDKNEWFRDFERLKKVQTLIDLSVLTGNEAAVTTLKNKVTTNFKAAYIADM